MTRILFALILPFATPALATPATFDACDGRIDPPAPVPTSYQIDLRYGHPSTRVVVDGETSPSLDEVSLRAGSEVEFHYPPLLTARRIADYARSHSPLQVFVDYQIGDRPEQTLELLLPDGPLDWETAATGTITLPEDATGALRYAFRLVGAADGQVREPATSSYQAEIAPQAEAVFCFGEDWEVPTDQPFVPGASITISYDVDRVFPMLRGTSYNGVDVWSVTAWLTFEDRNGAEIGRVQRVIKTPGFVPVAVTAVAPTGAYRMNVWFQGGAQGGNAYDSNFGSNYRFAARAAD